MLCQAAQIFTHRKDIPHHEKRPMTQVIGLRARNADRTYEAARLDDGSAFGGLHTNQTASAIKHPPKK